MSIRILEPDLAKDFYVLVIESIAGLNLRDQNPALSPDEANSLKNMVMIGRGIEKRKGIETYGSAMTGSKVVGLGHYGDDSGVVPLAMVNQTLYKYVGGAWTASDKTNYTANLDTQIVRFTSKSGSSLDSGTSTSGSGLYQVEDTGQTWVHGEHAGRCVVIEGEVKYIMDNTETVLLLSDKLNGNADSQYQSKAYAIFAVAPHAFILNGTDAVQKYDTTTTTAIDGTHVTDGKALPIATVGTEHQGRLWLAKGIGDDNDRAFISDTGIGENVTQDTNLNINLHFTNDGDKVQNIGSVPMENGAAVCVAKGESVHIVEGDNILNYTTRPVLHRDGCYARKSFATTRGSAFFLGKNGKVFSFSDSGQGLLSNALPISRGIEDAIKAHSASEQQNAAGIVIDNKYYLRVGNEAWYYDIEQSLLQNKHVWVEVEWRLGEMSPNVFANISDSLYAGDSVSGQVYLLNSGNDDDSDEIEGVIDLGEFSMPSGSHFWVERVEVNMESQASTVLAFAFATDHGSFSSWQSATLDDTSGRYYFNVRQRCRYLRIKFAEAGSETSARLNFPIRVLYRKSDSGNDGTKG